MTIVPEIDNLPLTEKELIELESAETAIERGLKATWEMWQALTLIRDRRLYRESYSTFEEYCLHRWSMTRVHAYRLIGAAEVRQCLSESPAKSMSPIGYILPENEAQTRPLTKLKSPEQVREAWNLAVATANGKPTASQVVDAVNQLLGVPQNPKQKLQSRKKRSYTEEEKDLGICDWQSDGGTPYFRVNLHEPKVGCEIKRIASELGKCNATAIEKCVEAYREVPSLQQNLQELEQQIESMNSIILSKDTAIAQKDAFSAAQNTKLQELELLVFELNRKLSEKDTALAELTQSLDEKDNKISELEALLTSPRTKS